MGAAFPRAMERGMARDEAQTPDREPVLLCVPDELTGASLRGCCLDAGWPVILAPGVEALRSALEASAPPAVVVADPVAAGLDPADLVALAGAGASPRPEILLLADREGAVARRRALEAGADEVLARPLCRAEVQNRIRRSLELRRARRRLATFDDTFARVARSLAAVGDDGDLTRDLVSEVARARREGAPLSLVAILPRRLPGLDDPAATSASALAIQATLRGTDRIFLLGTDAVLALLPECDPTGAETTLARLNRVLPPFPGFDLGHATLVEGDGRDGWDLLIEARRAALAAGAARAPTVPASARRSASR